MPSGVPAAAVPEAGDVADKNWFGPSRVSVGHRLGGLVIHLPSTARTSWPSYIQRTIVPINDSRHGVAFTRARCAASRTIRAIH